MQDEQLRPVLDRLLATRRAKVEDTQSGARKGLRVLFTCHSGKNKLLAIDLSRLVSKFVGDTEKNLDALFKAAEASDAVLLLDDTDELFGGTQWDAEESGRFPNLNVAQLRQRIESYDGVVLLGAANTKLIDPRLTRQCDEVVELADD
jgi:SpoVK/Ycf46/Vps4 family AAA+-type ATPase